MVIAATAMAAPAAAKKLVKAGEGYARTSVNTAVFRGSSIVSDGKSQYISFYDKEGHVIVGKRPLGSSSWELTKTQMKGNISDAHNVISLGIDGKGYLHISWDHHGNPLRYALSEEPGSLSFKDATMIGSNEENVTYPEFYTMPDGTLLFAYRDGASGNGNLVLDKYDTLEHTWQRLQDTLIDGEGKRNAYWQMYVAPDGVIHLSWVWRETWLVQTNHDLCYACSVDGGKTWTRSDGTPYRLPITEATAEKAWKIPQNSELINQTSMTADKKGHPYIATYWRDPASSVPQYRLVWHDGKIWRMQQIGERKTPFSLSGGGTKMIPIARPRVVSDGKRAYYIFRDEERGSRVSIATCPDLKKGKWEIEDVTDFSVGAWEPNYDINLWNTQNKLHIYVQPTLQGDGEQTATQGEASTPVYVLEYP